MATLPDSVVAKMTIKKMFGGVAFLYGGKMTVGVLNDDLMVRIIPEKMEAHLKMDHVEPMAFTGKPMREFVFVKPDGYTDENSLQYWIELGIEHAGRKLKRLD